MTRAPSFPCTLGVDWAGGSSYTNIGQVRDITGPNLSREQVDIPVDHDTIGEFRKYFVGAADGGELTFDLNLDVQNDAHIGDSGTGLRGSFNTIYSGTAIPAWEFANNGVGGTATWTFDGVMTGMDFNMGAVAGVSEASVTVKISGEPTLTIT